MAAEETAVGGVDEQRDAILKKVNRILRVVAGAVAELTELTAELNGDTRRKASAKDENGEPIWAFMVKQKVPKDMYVTKKLQAYGETFGFNKESMQILMNGLDSASGNSYEGFKRYYTSSGKKWENWSLVFMRWVRTEYDRKQQKANAPSGPGTKFDQFRTRS